MSGTEPNKDPHKKRMTAWMSPNDFMQGQTDAKVNMANHLDKYGVQRFLYKNYWLLLTVSLLLVLTIGGYVLYSIGGRQTCVMCGNKYPVSTLKELKGEQVCTVCFEKGK